MSDMGPRLLPGVDRLSTGDLRDQEADETLARRTAAMGALDTAARGGNPLSEAPRFGHVPPGVALEMQTIFERKKHDRLKAEVWDNPQSGWKELSQFWTGTMERYKAQNESQLIKKPRNEEEAMLQIEQLRPVVVDPNELATAQQALMAIDQQLKAIDPRDDVTKNPRTKHMAEWINREASPGQIGYLVSGEQKLEEGALMSAARIASDTGEMLLSPALYGIHGLWDIGRQAIELLGGPDMGPLTPTNYIEGPDGKIYHNGPKVPSHVDAVSMLWANATNKHVADFAAEVDRTRALARAQEQGFEKIAGAVSRTGGALAGFMVPGGAAMKVGGAMARGAMAMTSTGVRTLARARQAERGRSLLEKGLVSLGTLRLERGFKESERALKIVKLMSGLGAAAGNGMFEATAYGQVDGYAHAFLHGVGMTAPIMTLGVLGRSAERLLSTRAKMPKSVANVVSKGIEGLGFGAVEAHFPDLLPSSWGFMKDPNEETWLTYAKNAAAFMLMAPMMRAKGLHSPGEAGLQAMMFHVERSGARRTFAEKVARGEATPEEIAAAPTPYKELGQLSQQARESSDPAARMAAKERMAEIESRLDIQEHGVSPTPSEKAVAEAKPEVPADLTPEQMNALPLEQKRKLSEEQKKRLWVYNYNRLVGRALREAERQIEYEERVAHPPGLIVTKETQQVAGAEPQPLRQLERKPGPAEQMVQEGGKEGLVHEAERMPTAEERRINAERRAKEGRDPLEDPRFMDLPDDMRQELMKAPDAAARKQMFPAMVTERRKLAQRRVQTAKTKAERDAAMAEFRKLEYIEHATKREDVTDLGEGRTLEFRKSETAPENQEWFIRDEAGEILGHGFIRPAEGQKVEIWDANVRPEYEGQGLYGRVARELEKRFPGGIVPNSQSESAKGAWKAAGLAIGPGGEWVQIEKERPVKRLLARMERKGLFTEETKAIRHEIEHTAHGELTEQAKLRLMKMLDDARELGLKLPKDLVEAVEGEVMAGHQTIEQQKMLVQEALELQAKEAPDVEPAKSKGEQVLERAMPEVVEQRAAEARGPGGERAGPGSLQVPPTRQLEATPGVEKVRLSDIELEMQGRPGRKGIRIPGTEKRIGAVEPDPVRMTFRHGHISSEQRALGYYKIYGNLARTKDGLAAVEMAHEWAHGVQVRTLTGQGGQSFLRAAKAETKTLPPEIWRESQQILKDYPGAEKLPPVHRWMETWAEWHARNLLGEVGLDQKFPHLSAMFRAWLAHPQQARLRNQYLRIQDMYHRYNAQGALGRVEMLAHVEGDPISETAKETKDPISQRIAVAVDQILFDDAANLKAAQAKHLAMSGQDPSNVSIMEDPARLGDALAMTANKQAHYYVKQGFRHPDGTRTPGLEETWSKLQPGRETRDFYSYMISARSLELYNRGKEVNLPPQDFAYAVEQLKAKYPHFPEVAKAMKGWSDALIDTLARTGNWDPAKVERLKNTYTVYVPFFRMLKGDRKGPGTPTGSDKGTGISNIKGSTLEIRDPLVALQEVTARLISASHQNIIKSALYKLSHGHEAEGLATIIPRSKVPKDHEVAKVLDLIEKKLKGPLEEIGHDATDIFEALHDADALDPQIITTFIQRAVPTKGHNIVAFTPRLTEAEIADLVSKGASKEALLLNNEKLVWMELDPTVYEALMGLDKLPHVPAWMQPFMRVLQFPRDVVKFFATGVNPAFTAANWWRDNLVEPILSPSGKFNPLSGFTKSFRGALQRHKNGEMHQLYEEMGGGTASLLNDATKREIARAMPGIRQQFLKAMSWMQEKLAHPENYLREARFTDAYNKAKAEGKPELESRLLALESSKEVMNFIRAGVASRVMNIMTPYWSASLGGRKKVWRQLLTGGDGRNDAEKARIQRAAFMNAFASITLPSVVLWAFNHDEEWYQDLPDWRKALFWNIKITDDFILPLPKPFELGVIFGTIPEYILDHQVGDSNPVAVKEILKTTLGNYVEGAGSLVPAIIKPALEVTFDYDFFKMRRLTPEWIERSMPPEEQSTFYTTVTARLISKAIGGALTPIELEKLIGGYTAGKGVSAMRAIDEIASLRDSPLGMPVPWDRFVALPHSQSAFVDDLYQLSVSLEQREGDLTGRERGLKHRVDSAKQQISWLRKQQRAGKLSRAEAERKSYEIARPLVEESNR